jgi:hypothetical protein
MWLVTEIRYIQTKFLLGNKRPVVKQRHRWEENIKMDLTEWGVMEFQFIYIL